MRINLIGIFYLRKQARILQLYFYHDSIDVYRLVRLTSAEVNYDVSLTQQSIAISTDFRFAGFIYPIYVCG